VLSKVVAALPFSGSGGSELDNPHLPITLSLLYMFWALLAHHQELTKTVHAAYSDGMQ
jgi:hypothetical protein